MGPGSSSLRSVARDDNRKISMTRLLAALALLLFPASLSAQDAITPITPERCAHMKARRVLNAGAPVGCDRLRLLSFAYLGFDGQTHPDAELVVLDAVADHVLAIFVALRERGFPIAGVKLMDAFNGNDDAAIAANNTSSFNVRAVAGSGNISLHSYGVAIDLNPVQNPYVIRTTNGLIVEPRSAGAYANRRNQRPGMAEPVIALFAAHGFAEWGGRWANPTDYQHFQVGRGLAYRLGRLPPAQARELFEQIVQKRAR
jgi:D-alanyl-D-alanine carboxypeptidase